MKEKCSSFRKVQNPLTKKKPTIPKFENQCKVYSIKNIALEQEKKFQTQEQIQTQKQSCTLLENQPSHKNKNKQRQWKRSTIDLLATKQSGKSNMMKKSPSLSVYYCDSIAVRPMKQNQNLEDIFASSRQKIKQPTFGNVRNKQVGKTCQKQIKQSRFENKSKFNKKSQSTEIEQIITAQLKNRFRQRKRIFSTCENKKGLKLSRVIKTQMQIEQLNRIIGVDQFHITFQADKITQCCT